MNEMEEKVARFWQQHRIYEKVKAKNKGNETFYFCDGPPYVTGEIHPGTALNKVIKDVIIRFQRALGKDVLSKPGFDTHGLPIEVKVEQKLGIKDKKEIEDMGIEQFVKECKSFADHYIEVMTEQFKSVGVWMDWDTPYITYRDDYIEKVWETLKAAHEKGLLEKGNYVITSCPRCETSLANYELEYKEREDPSIYVKFKVEDNTFLIVWTTTPWTLVANVAAMVHPQLDYVSVKVCEETWIMAKDRMDEVLKAAGVKGEVVDRFKGEVLLNTTYEHPFQDLIPFTFQRKVVTSEEFVNTEEGSGIVHVAPGHGQEDFEVGKVFGLPVLSPVNAKGQYTEEAGEFFAGKSIWDANDEIIELLKQRGALVAHQRYKHRYPHCWRCKSPLFFRTTPQWFLKIEDVKEQMLSALNATQWVPAHAKKRIENTVKSAPNWCISRQRYWGIPLPIWRCERCGKIKVVGSKHELEQLSGKRVKELHRPYVDEVTFKCECGGEMRRVEDVLDVWVDSGNAVWASLSGEETRFGEVADFIVEGQDQTRGWFYSLLGLGVVKNGTAPYKTVMLHGFFVDEKGEKMSKSVGNFVPLAEILKKYGADAFRLWGLSNVLWEDIKFNWQGLKESQSFLNTFVNMATFVQRFYESNDYTLTYEDKWVLSRLTTVINAVKTHLLNYHVHEAVRLLRHFLLEDVSRFYMKLIKERREAVGVLYRVLLESTKVLALFAPFTAEHVYQQVFKRYENEESIHLYPYPQPSFNDPQLEQEMEKVRELVSYGLEQRQRQGVNVRWPLRRAFVSVDLSEGAKGVVKRLLNVKEVVFKQDVPVLELDFNVDEALELEGYFNELRRRVQTLRKRAGLVESDVIDVVVGGDEVFRKVLDVFGEQLKRRVGARAVVWGEGKERFTVKGKTLLLSIKVNE